MAYEPRGEMIAAVRINASRGRSGSACAWEMGWGVASGLSGKIGRRVKDKARASHLEEAGSPPIVGRLLRPICSLMISSLPALGGCAGRAAELRMKRRGGDALCERKDQAEYRRRAFQEGEKARMRSKRPPLHK